MWYLGVKDLGLSLNTGIYELNDLGDTISLVLVSPCMK